MVVLPCPTPLLIYVRGDTWRECHRAVCLAERNIPQCINICGSSTGGPLSVVNFTTSKNPAHPTPTHGRLQSLFNARTGSVIEAQKTTNSRHFPTASALFPVVLKGHLLYVPPYLYFTLYWRSTIVRYLRRERFANMVQP